MNSYNPVGIFVPVDVVFPDTQDDYESFCEVLQHLSRTDVFFWCSRLNLVLAADAKLSPESKQEFGLRQFLTKSQIESINEYFSKQPKPRKIVAFFRGQLLELIRWACLLCHDHPADGRTFEDPDVRQRFAKAALIASEIWSRRVFGQGYQRFSADEGISKGRVKALGSIRKSLEATLESTNLSRILGRGWQLFRDYVPTYISDFDAIFQKATGLTFEDYYICLTAFYVQFTEGTGIFPAFTLGENTPFAQKFQTFLSNEAQDSDDLKKALWGNLQTLPKSETDAPPYDYRPFREKPILCTKDGRGIIIDPIIFGDTATVGPLFKVVKKCPTKTNEIFGGFGFAFEGYACDILKRMYPTGKGLADRLKCNIPLGDREIDAYLDDGPELTIFEMKSVRLREDQILEDAPGKFAEHLRERYGISQGSKGDRSHKGAAQLAKIVRLIVDPNSQIRENQFPLVEVISPVIVVHDILLSAPVYGSFLADEFTKALSPDRIDDFQHMWIGRVRIRPLTVMTIEDLENLETSTEHFSLQMLLKDYAKSHPDRTVSLHDYLASSKYKDMLYYNRNMATQSYELLTKTMGTVFPES